MLTPLTDDQISLLSSATAVLIGGLAVAVTILVIALQRKNHWSGKKLTLIGLGAGIAVIVISSGGGVAAVKTLRPAPHDDRPKPARPPSDAPTPEAPRLIVGPLGDNSRCGRQTSGPAETVWRVCAGVTPDSISFALMITNNGSAPATVATYLEYVRTGTYLSCPEMTQKQEVTVPAGEETVIGDAQCSVPREDEPFVYQGRGWVADAEATSATIKKSPNAHVHPDGSSSWDPDLIAD